MYEGMKLFSVTGTMSLANTQITTRTMLVWGVDVNDASTKFELELAATVGDATFELVGVDVVESVV